MNRHFFQPFGHIVLKLPEDDWNFRGIYWYSYLLTVFQSLLATDIEAARADISKISTPLVFYSIFRYIESISKK